MARLTAALLSLLTLASEGLAQAPADDADEQLFINARIITGDGSIIENGSLLISGDVILAVGVGAAANASASSVRHDLNGKTIMPALVNTHAHLGWEAYGD